MKMYDVIIVGAGPAGLFAAYELITKNKNLKIAILVISYQVMVVLEHFLMVN